MGRSAFAGSLFLTLLNHVGPLQGMTSENIEGAISNHKHHLRNYGQLIKAIYYICDGVSI